MLYARVNGHSDIYYLVTYYTLVNYFNLSLGRRWGKIASLFYLTTPLESTDFYIASYGHCDIVL